VGSCVLRTPPMPDEAAHEWGTHDVAGPKGWVWVGTRAFSRCYGENVTGEPPAHGPRYSRLTEAERPAYKWGASKMNRFISTIQRTRSFPRRHYEQLPCWFESR
jgi:hypothetical protein